MEEKKEVKFDPNVQYKWNPQDIFYMSGSDFANTLNTVRSILNTEVGRIVMNAARADAFLTATLARAVETGIAKEDIPIKKEEKPQEPEMKLE